VMTIAGSDSGGGAGIQADLKAFSAFGVFGTSAITCITAQNPDRVEGVAAIDPEMVALQIRTVCDGFPVCAAKTGMLYSQAIIRLVADTVRECGIPLLVVDPVMVATSGARLLRDDAVDALCSVLLPRATVITPNLPEAEILTGHKIESEEELEKAAGEISAKFGAACIAKGGHLGNPSASLRAGAENVVDVLCAAGKTTVFSSPRISVAETHGTGCTFSAALTACLALGETLERATERAKKYVSDALRHAPQAGSHHPLA